MPVLVRIGWLLLLAGCSVTCVCSEAQHMKVLRMSTVLTRVGADIDEVLSACESACTR